MSLAAHLERQDQWTWKCNPSPPKKGGEEENEKDPDWSPERKKKARKNKKRKKPQGHVGQYQVVYSNIWNLNLKRRECGKDIWRNNGWHSKFDLKNIFTKRCNKLNNPQTG